MPNTDYVVGSKSFLALSSEAIWGRNANDASGSASGAQGFNVMPPLTYTVAFTPERRNATPYTGLRQRKHGRFFRGMPQGQLTTPLYGWWPVGLGESFAEYLMDWGFGNHEDLNLPSKTAQWAEGPGLADKEHTGLLVNTATLSGSDDSGGLDLALDLMGKDEEGDGFDRQSIPNNLNQLLDFQYPDITFTVADVGGGNEVTTLIRNFQWQVQNNLQVVYNNSTRPSIIVPNQRIETFQFTLVKTGDVYDAFRRVTTRNRKQLKLTIKGLHNGTGASGNFTQCVITFPAAEYSGHTDSMSISQLTEQPLQWEIHKPDTSSNGSAMVWSLEA